MKNLNSFLFVFLFLSGLFATNVFAQRYDIIDIVSAGNPGPYPYDINNKNQIIGDYSPYFPTTVQAFIYENGSMSKLITDPLITSSHAYRINDSSQVVGKAVFPLLNGTSVWHAFFRAEGVLTDIDMSGGPSSSAAAINNKGQVVISFLYTTANKVHSFIWQNGAITNLVPMVFPDEINNHGQVVGQMRMQSFKVSNNTSAEIIDIANENEKYEEGMFLNMNRPEDFKIAKEKRIKSIRSNN